MTDLALDRTKRPEAGFAALDYGLYAAVVVLWGTSWLALHLQLGVVAPEVSVTWRFAIAAAVMMAWVMARRGQVAFPLAEHLRFAVLGLTLFSSNFLFFYYGGLTTPSGLLAVAFSLTSVFNMILGAIFFSQRPSLRIAIAALMGFAGVGAMFEPQITGAGFTPAAMHGLLFCLAGTISFCLGNILSLAGQRRGVPIASSTAWGMSYGVAFLAAFTLIRGQSFTVEWTLTYIGGLFWLAIMSSVLAFAAYLRLLARIGPARAGYSTVLYPVVALAISTLVEGYVWTPVAIAGLVLVLGGNLVMLSKGR